MVKFNSIEELEYWLKQKGIDVKSWGVDGAKSLQNLWRELKSGDASLQETPPLRIVHVVQIHIHRGNHILLETIQEMADGQKRYRNQPPAEKMKANEHYLDAASRGLYEELGILRDQITFDQSSHFSRTLISESPSYPGLDSQYTFHDVKATVEGLPEESFWFENYAFENGDPVKRHFWAWCLPEEMNIISANMNSA